MTHLYFFSSSQVSLKISVCLSGISSWMEIHHLKKQSWSTLTLLKVLHQYRTLFQGVFIPCPSTRVSEWCQIPGVRNDMAQWSPEFLESTPSHLQPVSQQQRFEALVQVQEVWLVTAHVTLMKIAPHDDPSDPFKSVSAPWGWPKPQCVSCLLILHPQVEHEDLKGTILQWVRCLPEQHRQTF